MLHNTVFSPPMRDAATSSAALAVSWGIIVGTNMSHF